MFYRLYTDIDFLEGPLQDFWQIENAENIRNNPQANRGQQNDALAAEPLCGCENRHDSEEGDSRCKLEDGYCSFLEALDTHSQIPVQLYDIPWSLVDDATYIPWCCTEPYTCYPQHLACLFGNKDLATMMFEKKAADIHARDSRDNTTLMLAAASGSAMTMVSLLLLLCQDEDDRKKLVTAHNKDGLTALHFAALSDDPQVVDLLLDVGADVNAGQFTTLQNRRFALTPLHFALVRATRPAVSIAKMLVKSGADLSLEAAKVNSTVPCATFVSDICCRLLLPSYGAWYDGEINSKGTALHLAVKRGVDLSDILSEKQNRLLLNIPDSSGYLPLHTAVEDLDQQAIKILLSLGADVNAVVSGNGDEQGRTALHILFNLFHHASCARTLQFIHNFKSCVSLLLQQPLVNLNARDREGKTPLHVACERGHYAFIEQLVASGANVLVEDNIGRTPIYCATCPEDRSVREKLVDVLLRFGAALSCLNTPFELSLVIAFYEHCDVAILLKLYRLGAITTQDLKILLHDFTIIFMHCPVLLPKQRKKIVRAATAALQQEVLNPLSLYAQSIICVSRYIKAGSPQSRREAFMSLELDHFTLSTMQDLCLM